MRDDDGEAAANSGDGIAGEKPLTGESLIATTGTLFPSSPKRWSRWGLAAAPPELKAIESAPRDGRKVRGFRQVDGTWVSFEIAWRRESKAAGPAGWATAVGQLEHPTHWQPDFYKAD